MKIELTVGELKELFFNESSTNRIKLSSNESPFVPSKKTIEDFKEITEEEAKNMQKPMPHEDFVKMGKDILDKNHKHKPGRPKKVIE